MADGWWLVQVGGGGVVTQLSDASLTLERVYGYRGQVSTQHAYAPVQAASPPGSHSKGQIET